MVIPKKVTKKIVKVTNETTVAESEPMPQPEGSTPVVVQDDNQTPQENGDNAEIILEQTQEGIKKLLNKNQDIFLLISKGWDEEGNRPKWQVNQASDGPQATEKNFGQGKQVYRSRHSEREDVLSWPGTPVPSSLARQKSLSLQGMSELAQTRKFTRKRVKRRNTLAREGTLS